MVKIKLVNLENPPLIQTSDQTALLPKILGRVRVAGQVIWADEFKISDPSKKNDQIGTGFSLSFAIALCEGEIDHIAKIWVNDELLDIGEINWRYYPGSGTQTADPLLENIYGVGKAPAFKDVAYVVIEDLLLQPFGNMVPKFSFEVVNAIGKLESQIKAVSIIPGATEFGYHTVSIMRANWFEYLPENQHGFSGQTDFLTSIDELCNLCPLLESVSLIVPWFGDDLRASDIEIKPCVDSLTKTTLPEQWVVNGISRGQAKLVSQIDGQAAFGGTPSDASIVAAIAEFKLRDLKIMFYPFILMDVAAGNILTNPQGGTGQPIYPWRGRITCTPAIGQPSTPDQTAPAATQVQQFFGNCQLGDLQVNQNTVSYIGAADWGYRRMILHYAKLCAVAGGVEAFLLGSELVGLTTVRDSKNHFPAIDELIDLAGLVKQVMPTSLISYGADWSEYFGYHAKDGSGDLLFHLDEFWANANVDFIGIDAYWPLSDWRDDDVHLDKSSANLAIYDRDYLAANIGAGEGYDYYYNSAADRTNQTRTAIIDTAYNKHWVFRNKDLKSWWLNSHFDRIDGVEQPTPTAWIAESKPFWLTEIGCPAIDKGSNQPNVFYDPASSEGQIPYFANLNRDDIIQRRYLESFLTHYQASGAHNPISAIYGGNMLDVSQMYIWAYDARPFPAFPLLINVWADGTNWSFGHWLNGRLGAVPLDLAINELTQGLQTDVSAIVGQVDGYIIDHADSPLATLQNLMENFGLYAFIRDDVLIFKHQSSIDYMQLDALNISADKNTHVATKSQQLMPTDVHLKYISDDGNYTPKVTSEIQNFDLLTNPERRNAHFELPAILSKQLAAKLVANHLTLIAASSDKISLSLAAEFAELECGDVFDLDATLGRPELAGKWRIVAIIQTPMEVNGLLIEAVSIVENFDATGLLNDAIKQGKFDNNASQGPGLLVEMNLPLMAELSDIAAISVAAFTKPWQAALRIYEDVNGAFDQRLSVAQPAIIGETLWDFYSGPVDRIDRGNQISVRLYDGNLASISDSELLAGKNLACIQNVAGDWEIIQFKTATFVAENEYILSHFIRGRYGTFYAMSNPVLTGARFVILDDKILHLSLNPDEILSEMAIKYGPANKILEDASYLSGSLTHTAQGQKPFAPAHVSSKNIADDIELNWIRQSRFGGENWAISQVPLNEQKEAYEVEIWSDDLQSLKRTLTTNVPTITYSAAFRTADFGNLTTNFKLKIYQMSALVGRGIATEAEIYV